VGVQLVLPRFYVSYPLRLRVKDASSPVSGEAEVVLLVADTTMRGNHVMKHGHVFSPQSLCDAAYWAVGLSASNADSDCIPRVLTALIQ